MRRIWISGIALLVSLLATGQSAANVEIPRERQIDQQRCLTIYVSYDGVTTFSREQINNFGVNQQAQKLSIDESIALLYVHDKELLSYRMNMLMDAVWKKSKFKSLSAAENSHLALIHTLMRQNDLSDNIFDAGEDRFLDPTLNHAVIALSQMGTSSVVDALIATASVEESAVVELDLLRSYIGHLKDIDRIFDYLGMASRNHLRSIVSSLAELGHTYEPVYMTTDFFDFIIDHSYETDLANSNDYVYFGDATPEPRKPGSKALSSEFCKQPEN